jgi:predicted dehydrogenase
MARYDMEQFLANPRVKVTALCDVDASFLAAARKLVPDARIYRDWRELLASEGDRIDSLNVSTPDHTHAVIAANAMRRGKHVYCQKPLCKYMDESAALRALAANSGVVTQLGTQIAAGSCERTAVEAMRSGMIGPVRRVILFSTRNAGSRMERTVPLPAPVPATLDWDKWIGPAPMRPYSPVYHPLNWRIFTDFGSGWVGDLCIHLASCVWLGLGIGRTMPSAVRADVNADCIHGNIAQTQREKTMQRFRDGKLQVLIATDVAARGIDVDDVDCVINYDIPEENEYYIHRIGRTGRARKKGVSFAIVGSFPEQMKLNEIAKFSHFEIQPVAFNEYGLEKVEKKQPAAAAHRRRRI